MLRSGVLVAGRFRLLHELGRGGMGAVWLAHHESLDARCAIKFILERPGEGSVSEVARARFKHEARAAARLRSPHVVQIFDYGVWNDLPYIVMEHLVGESLTERLDREGVLDLVTTARIVDDVAKALDRAEAVGIVHRDLKPDNLFLVEDPHGLVVKVLDFGVAKVQRADGWASLATASGALLGTPHYLSPEQAHGARDVDHRADLWSLAVIVFECLSGGLPFDSEGLGDLIAAILHAPVPSLAARAPELPPAIDAWWFRAAARDPDARFQHASEMAEALRGVAEAQPPVKPPVRSREALAETAATPSGIDRGESSVEATATLSGQQLTEEPGVVPGPWRVAAVVALTLMGLGVRLASLPPRLPRVERFGAAQLAASVPSVEAAGEAERPVLERESEAPPTATAQAKAPRAVPVRRPAPAPPAPAPPAPAPPASSAPPSKRLEPGY